MTLKTNPFAGLVQELPLPDARAVKMFSLEKYAVEQSVDLGKLPFCTRILLECVLRNCDNISFSEPHAAALLRPRNEGREIPFFPARVILQDFTGVPAVVDLAMLRDEVVNRGGKAELVNPVLPCQLVIDHSLNVDYAASADAQQKNEQLEVTRNRERYRFLKWAQSAFRNFEIVPPGSGIIHQVNLEYLAQAVFLDRAAGFAYPDSCLGTDSHTTTVCGMGVLAWGVGGIEAEAVLLGQPYAMLVPPVVGIKISGELKAGVTATDLALYVTQFLRALKVVGKFVEFFGPGMAALPVADRAALANMAPEQGSTVSFFPFDQAALEYLRFSGRTPEQLSLVERYLKSQGLFFRAGDAAPEYDQVVELDLALVEPAVAGPKRPQDLVPLGRVKADFSACLAAPEGPKGFGADAQTGAGAEGIKHGAVVLAAITSCTNTSNPALMIAAGLLAKKAVERGLRVAPHVKTSLAPGSRVVAGYLAQAGLTPYLEELGFHIVGFGCTTCIGNSGPLHADVVEAVKGRGTVVVGVLSGNRNFEGRVHPLVRANYLASPPLVVAYALAGRIDIDLLNEPLGTGADGRPVFFSDLWPLPNELTEIMQTAVTPELFTAAYADVYRGAEAWEELPRLADSQYVWDPGSDYLRKPPFIELEQERRNAGSPSPLLHGGRVLALFGDSISTDHISPAGAIAADSPAGRYLRSKNIGVEDFNSYGARRGNYEVMVRGTFANNRLKNKLVDGAEGNWTVHHPSGDRVAIYEAAARYAETQTPLLVIAGREYGCGSSRDWAAKGPYLLGVRAVIAESFERIHRSNLIGMGILPLEFDGESAQSLGLAGTETYSLLLGADLLTLDNIAPGQRIRVRAARADGREQSFDVLSRIDSDVEASYFKTGGILPFVLEKICAAGSGSGQQRSPG